MQEFILEQLGKTHHLLTTNTVESLDLTKLKLRAQCIAYFTDLVGLSRKAYELEYFNLAGRSEDALINIIETYINPKFFDSSPPHVYIPEYDSWKIIFAILAEEKISLDYREILQVCLAQILPLKHLNGFPELPNDLQNTLLSIFKKEYPIALTWKAPTRMFSKKKEFAYVQLEKLKSDSSIEDYLGIISAIKITPDRPELRESNVHAFYRKWQILLNINHHNPVLSSTTAWAEKLEQKKYAQTFEENNLTPFIKDFYNYCQYPILEKMIARNLQNSTIKQDMIFLRKNLLVYFARQVYQQNFDRSWLPKEEPSSLSYLLETVGPGTASGYTFRTKINVQTILINLSKSPEKNQDQIIKFNYWLVILTLLENDELNENETTVLKYCIAQLIPTIKKYLEFNTTDLVKKLHLQFLQEINDDKWSNKGGIFMKDLPRNIAALKQLGTNVVSDQHKKHLLEIDGCLTRSPVLDQFYSKWQVLLGGGIDEVIDQDVTENYPTETLILTAADVLLKLKRDYEGNKSAGDSRTMMRLFLNRAVENLVDTIYSSYKSAIDLLTTHNYAKPKTDQRDLIFIPTNHFSVKTKLLPCLSYLREHRELFGAGYKLNNSHDQKIINDVHKNYYLWEHMLCTVVNVVNEINRTINAPELLMSGQNNNVTTITNQNDDTVSSALDFKINL